MVDVSGVTMGWVGEEHETEAVPAHFVSALPEDCAVTDRIPPGYSVFDQFVFTGMLQVSALESVADPICTPSRYKRIVPEKRAIVPLTDVADSA